MWKISKTNTYSQNVSEYTSRHEIILEFGLLYFKSCNCTFIESLTEKSVVHFKEYHHLIL